MSKFKLEVPYLVRSIIPLRSYKRVLIDKNLCEADGFDDNFVIAAQTLSSKPIGTRVRLVSSTPLSPQTSRSTTTDEIADIHSDNFTNEDICTLVMNSKISEKPFFDALGIGRPWKLTGLRIDHLKPSEISNLFQSLKYFNAHTSVQRLVIGSTYPMVLNLISKHLFCHQYSIPMSKGLTSERNYERNSYIQEIVFQFDIMYEYSAGSLGSIASLTSLRILQLGRSGVTGSVDKDLLKMSNLLEIDLSYSFVHAEISNLNHYTNLKKLVLKHCAQVGGVLTCAFFQPMCVPNIEHLDLSYSAIRGEFGEIFKEPTPNLKILKLNGLNIRGDIESLKFLSNLKVLELENNPLVCGQLASLQPLSTLSKLVLDSTSVCGRLDDLCVDTLASLHVLSLKSVSGVVGDIQCLTKLRNLRIISLTHNENIMGDFLEVIRTLTRVEHVSLSHTKVIGSFSLMKEIVKGRLNQDGSFMIKEFDLQQTLIS